MFRIKDIKLILVPQLEELTDERLHQKCKKNIPNILTTFLNMMIYFSKEILLEDVYNNK